MLPSLDEIIKDKLNLADNVLKAAEYGANLIPDYINKASAQFYAGYSPRRYQRAGDLSNIGVPLGAHMTGQYSAQGRAKTDGSNVFDKPAYQWGKNPNSGMIISGEQIFQTAWFGGMHGAWYVAATSASPESLMTNYMEEVAQKAGSYLISLLG